jgi:hypothetical protein
MIEAVNSTVANASSLRANAEAVSVLRTAADAAPPVSVGDTKVAQLPKAPYISPYIVIDQNYNKAVLQIRDSDTGDVVQQFPTESRLAQISRVQAKAQRAVDASVAPQQQQSQQAIVQTLAKESYITTVQEFTASSPPANVPSPQAIAALSSGAQAGQSAQTAKIDVFA